jgi:hypothetical protein
LGRLFSLWGDVEHELCVWAEESITGRAEKCAEGVLMAAKKRKKKRSTAKHRVKNPKPVGLFKTKAAARKYAREHARPGVKFSVKKLKRGK